MNCIEIKMQHKTLVIKQKADSENRNIFLAFIKDFEVLWAKHFHFLLYGDIISVEGHISSDIVCQKGGAWILMTALARAHAARGSQTKVTTFPKKQNEKPEISEKGKPFERMGRKAMGPKAQAMAARPPIFRFFPN